MHSIKEEFLWLASACSAMVGAPAIVNNNEYCSGPAHVNHTFHHSVVVDLDPVLSGKDGTVTCLSYDHLCSLHRPNTHSNFCKKKECVAHSKHN